MAAAAAREKDIELLPVTIVDKGGTSFISIKETAEQKQRQSLAMTAPPASLAAMARLAAGARLASTAPSASLAAVAGKKQVDFDFDLKLMQVESEHMEIPVQQCKVTAKLPSAECHKFAGI